MLEITLIILAALFMLPGLLGIILPVLPGVPFMFLIALVYGIATKFELLVSGEITWLGVLVIVSLVVDYFAGLIGAKFGGASGKSLLIGLAGFLLGMILLPPLGGLLGMFVGIIVGEIYFLGKTKTALRAATGGALGAVAGMVINLVIGLTFVGLFLFFVLNS